MIKRHPIHDNLKAHPLFAEFNDEDLEQLLECAEPALVSKGELIVRQGDSGRSMFLLAEGEASVLMKDKIGTEIKLAKIKPGDFIGELSLIDNEPRSADVIAKTDCMVMKITMPMMRMFAQQSPSAGFKLAMAVLELVSGRLRKTNSRYMDSIGILSSLSGELSMMDES